MRSFWLEPAFVGLLGRDADSPDVVGLFSVGMPDEESVFECPLGFTSDDVPF